ncbi:hypothetical protein [uncultured Veillonella sp.]|uniref:hypothetical protein n=1 Tax=uncultured Veillonella sp. TaxID=159268 RepID=UPI0025F83E8D|nr:hypothetical protein [uncultured Veillonella sp.]
MGKKDIEVFDRRTAIDTIAELEVMALKEGLEDPELRRNPSFLEKVRRFMKDHRLETTANLTTIVQQTVAKEIPIFDDDEEED